MLLTATGCSSAIDDTQEALEQEHEPHLEPAEQCGTRAAADATAEELSLNAWAELDVGTTLLGHLSDQNPNVLVSPFSLRMAFGQVYAGTQGPSRDELETALGFGALGERSHAVLNTVSQTLEARNQEATEYSPALVVRPVNRSFFDIGYERSINDQWAQAVQSFYGTCIEVFDMNRDHQATLAHVNGWVADQTNDLIPNLVKSLPETVSLILINALYFKASWGTPFTESLTASAPFTTWEGVAVDVEMMRSPTMSGQYAESEGWQAVALPYADQRLEMVVILPGEDEQTSFAESLDADVLTDVFEQLTWTVVDLRLPKFDLMSTWGLRSTLEAMGMDAAFSRGQDFSPIADGMMPIFEVFHDVAIAIDEDGTEAAAATAVVFGDDGGEEPVSEVSVVVDRTFYVAIRDREAGSVLFLARIGDPTG